jgi:outer membrane lipoprotein LolB
MRRLAAVLALLGSACATVAPPIVSPGGEPSALASPFVVEGRLSARRGADGGAAHFTWQHDGLSDRIDLATPLGQTLARLTGTADGVRAEWPDGRTLEARDWDVMTARVLGVPVPVQGLAAWLRGQSRGTTPSTVERDARGRTAVLAQDGWEIVYAYADDAALHPSRLTLRFAQGEPTEVRLVVDRWE